jgi:hypothetical protein
MTIDEIQRFKKHVPFEPFEIVLVDGRRFPVPLPDFILVPPRGTWVYVTDRRGRTAHINAVVISSVRRLHGGGRRRRAG